MASMVLNPKFEEYALQELKDRVSVDRELAEADVMKVLWDQAFEAAYRNGLGNSAISSSISSETITVDSMMQFVEKLRQRAGHVVAAYGLNALEFSQQLKSSCTHKFAPLQAVSQVAKYFGGERRLESSSERNNVLVAFPLPGLMNELDDFMARLIAALVGGSPNVPFGGAHSVLPTLAKILVDSSNEVSVRPEILQYSNGGLLGIHVSAPARRDMRPVLETLCKDLKQIGSLDLSQEQLASIKAKAHFTYSSFLDSRIAQVLFATQQVFPLFPSIIVARLPFAAIRRLKLISKSLSKPSPPKISKQ